MSALTPEQRERALAALNALQGFAHGYMVDNDAYDTSKILADDVRAALVVRTCGTCRHSGECGIQVAVISSRDGLRPNRWNIRAGGCLDGWEAKQS